MLIRIDNVNAVVHFDKETQKQSDWLCDYLHRSIDVLDPDRFHQASFIQYRTWDGYTKNAVKDDKGNLVVKTGLISKMYKAIARLQEKAPNVSYKVIDSRGPRVEPCEKIPDKVYLDSGISDSSFYLHDYQREQVVTIFNEQRGYILSAVNSGKSAVAYETFKLAVPTLNEDELALFVAPNKNIEKQMLKNMKLYLDCSVGEWADGVKDIQQVTVATIQTIASAIKKPKVKITRSKDRLLYHMATLYAPDIIDSVNPRSTLKYLIKNFVIEYKYQPKELEYLKGLYNNLSSNSAVKQAFKDMCNSYYSLLDELSSGKYTKYIEAKNILKHVRIVFVDEVQHAGSTSYRRALGLMTNARMRIGMSGTVPKSKENDINAYLGDRLSDITNDSMIKMGVSTPIEIIPVVYNTPDNLEEIVDSEMARQNLAPDNGLLRYQFVNRLGIVDNDSRNKYIADLATKLSDLKSGAVYIAFNNIEHGENIAKFLDDNGTDYVVMQGSTSDEERQEILKGLVSGEVRVILGSKVLDEGVSVPTLKYLLYVSGGQSEIQVGQRVGRILRLGSGKDKVYVYDFQDHNSKFLYKHAKARMKLYRQEKYPIKEV